MSGNVPGLNVERTAALIQAAAFPNAVRRARNAVRTHPRNVENLSRPEPKIQSNEPS